MSIMEKDYLQFSGIVLINLISHRPNDAAVACQLTVPTLAAYTDTLSDCVYVTNVRA